MRLHHDLGARAHKHRLIVEEERCRETVLLRLAREFSKLGEIVIHHDHLGTEFTIRLEWDEDSSCFFVCREKLLVTSFLTWEVDANTLVALAYLFVLVDDVAEMSGYRRSVHK